MLDATLKSQLSTYLTNLRHPIELVITTDHESAVEPARAKTIRQMNDLLDDIANLSDLVTVREDNTLDVRRPSFLITRPGEDSGVRFAGVPMGHEFTSLVLALLHVGGHPAKEEAALLEQVSSLKGPLHFETYFSLTCQNCPDVVQALNLMSALNPNITHTAIEGGAFADEVEQRQVMSVPSVFVNGEPFGQGRMTLAEIVGMLDDSVGERETEQMNERETYDVLVIGGGPAGTTAAIYAARKGIRTGLVAKKLGGQVLDTGGIENFTSILHTEGPAFGAALEQHVRDYDVDVISRQHAVALHPGTEPGAPIEIEFDNGARLTSRTVIVATGARWRTLSVPGEDDYLNKGVTYCPHCDGPLFKGKKVAVIGGGNSGVEAAIDLAGLCEQVTLFEFDTHLRADEVLQRKLRSMGNTAVHTSAQVNEVAGDGSKVTGVSWIDRANSTEEKADLDGIFVQIGLLPNTEWLEGTVDLNKRGEIVIDGAGCTEIPGLFAAGDCTTVPYKQIVTAAGSGATAALSAFDYLIRVTAPA